MLLAHKGRRRLGRDFGSSRGVVEEDFVWVGIDYLGVKARNVRKQTGK
jgi:hypothetical protein